MLLSKKKLYKIKKSKNQSQKKYNKKRKKKKKGRKRRSFSKRKKHLNLKNKSLKFRIKKQKGGNNRIDFQLIFLTSQDDEGNYIMKLINFKLPLSEFENFLNQIPLQKFINMIDSLSPGDEDYLAVIENIKLLNEVIVKSIDFEHVGKVVNIYNYNSIKHILLRKISNNTITGLKILGALKRYIEGEAEIKREMGPESLRLANAVFSDVDSATGPTPDSTVDDSGQEPPPIPPRPESPPIPPRPEQEPQTPSRIGVIDVAGDGSSRKSDEPTDNDWKRGDERMTVYTDYVKKTPTETTTKETEYTRRFFNKGDHKVTDTKTTVGETPWKKVPLSLGARDPIHKKNGMGSTNTRDGPSYPHNLVFEITTKNDADGTKTNMNILDAGDGPLTVDAFNELLLKKYRYKKPRTKEEMEEQDGYDDDDDSEEEDFGTEEEDEAVKSDEGKEPEAQTINEGDVEITLPLDETPQLGSTINIRGENSIDDEDRIVIEADRRGSDGVLLGGGKIMRGGNPKKYRLHLDKPLLYKHEKPKTNISEIDAGSLQEMHEKFERQLKEKYGDGETYTNIKNKIQELTMDDIQNNLSTPDFISQIKQRAVESAEIAKAAAPLQPGPEAKDDEVDEDNSDEERPEPPPRPEPAPAPAPEPEPEQSTEINLLLEKNKYNKPYKPLEEEEKVMKFIHLVGGWRNFKRTVDEINAQKENKKDRKEQLESKLKEIMKKACPEEFDEDLYTGDFNEIIIKFLKTDAMKYPPKIGIEGGIKTNIECIKDQLNLFFMLKKTILTKIEQVTLKVANKEALKTEAHRTRGMGKKAPPSQENAVSVGDFFAQFEQDESIPTPKRKQINKKLFYTKKLDFINEIIHKWREWNAEAIKINKELKDMGNTESESGEGESATDKDDIHIISSLLEMNETQLGENSIEGDEKELVLEIMKKKNALYKFIPTEDDTLITLINKFIYFNFIYNKLIESGEYNSWKAKGKKPSAIEHMQLVFFDNIRYNKKDDKRHMNKVIIPLFKLYDEFFKLCRNTILSFEIFEEICKFSVTKKFDNLHIYTHCVGKFTELKNLWINYVKNISMKIFNNNNDTNTDNGNILHIFKYTINEFMTTFTEDKIKEYSLVKNILENVINKSINSEDIKNSGSKKPDKIMLKIMIKNLQNVKKTFGGGKEPSGDIWRDCYVKTFAQGPTRITLILEDMCNAYKFKYLPKDEPRNLVDEPVDRIDERWVMVGQKRTTLKTEKKYVDRVKVDETIKPCPGENEASSIKFNLKGGDNVIKMNIYTMRLEGEPKKYVKYHCYRYFNFVPKKYNGKDDGATLKNYEEMRKRLTIDYQYTLMQRDIRDGIVETNNKHLNKFLGGAATKLFLNTRDPYSPFYMEKVTEDGEEKSKMVDYNTEGVSGDDDVKHFAPVTPPNTPRNSPPSSDNEDDEEEEKKEEKEATASLLPPGNPLYVKAKNMTPLQERQAEARQSLEGKIETKLDPIGTGAVEGQEVMEGGKRKKKKKKKKKTKKKCKTKKNKTKKRKRKQKKRKKK